jgi:hypothetical protein
MMTDYWLWIAKYVPLNNGRVFCKLQFPSYLYVVDEETTRSQLG